MAFETDIYLFPKLYLVLGINFQALSLLFQIHQSKSVLDLVMVSATAVILHQGMTEESVNLAVTHLHILMLCKMEFPNTATYSLFLLISIALIICLK